MDHIREGLQSGVLLRHDTYRIERVLGQGGFGVTYLATDLNLDRKVAIKEFFPKDYCERDGFTSKMKLATKSSKEFVERLKDKFLKEARNIAKFDHPNIIKIHAAFEENNTAYYVMDYISGGSLMDIVKKEGPLEEHRALGYIKKVASALEYVHAHKVNHLDVKPANIMVRQDNDAPILIDFGLSKQYNAEGLQTSTTPVGISHGFAPTEQYTAGGVKLFSPQTDIYSLAATLYYLLSGIIPPPAPELIENELAFPQAIPARWIAPIIKAMSPIRYKRYGAVSDFIVALNMEHPEPKPRKKILTTIWSSIVEFWSKRTAFQKWGVVIVPMGILFLFLFGRETPDPYPSSELLSLESDSLEETDDSMDYVADSLVSDDSVVLASDNEFPGVKPAHENRPTSSQVNAFALVEPSHSGQKTLETSVSGSANGHDYVDLGLSVLWATCNVGASSPEGYGEYFAWGEVREKEKYTKENSKTYGKSMGDIGGDPNYDAATNNWGGSWRLPTKSEFQELKDKCTTRWTTHNGVNGYLVTNKKNGNMIFLPAAGGRDGTSLYPAGEYGSYWSSTPREDGDYRACCLGFNGGYFDWYWDYRYFGHSVRPVRER